MTKIVIPDDITIFHSEAKRLREERDKAHEELAKANNEFGSETWDWPNLWRRIADLKDLSNRRYQRIEELQDEVAKVREVNAEQANQITYWRDRAHHAEDQLRRAQQLRLARSGE